ncbi:MAG: DEAD/DEAH box helicase, partial [Actinomycetota bacterium]|nr:DEAD/DEAH box helicase [Actinomycetota bacterium]
MPGTSWRGGGVIKVKVGAPVRTLLNTAQGILAEFARLEQHRHALDARASELTDRVCRAETDRILRAKPVAELRDLVGKGTRFGKLEGSSFTTIADVAKARPDQLSELPGLGAKSAADLVAAARRLSVQVHAQTTVRLDPDRPHRDQTALLGTLVALRALDERSTHLRGDIERFTREISLLIEVAEPATGRISLFLAGKNKRAGAEAAVDQLHDVLGDSRIAGLREAAAVALQPETLDTQQLWQSYARDAASINAVLSTVPGAIRSDDTEGGHGHAPSELVERIKAVPLDTSGLTATLRGYQVFGAQYAILQERAILGDEMGLGKTIQALAAAAHLAAKGQRRMLVVCPASVLVNWLNEIEKHTTLIPRALYGADRETATMIWRREGGVAVTTFSTLAKLSLPKDVDIGLVIVDEAHYVKNPQAQRSRAVIKVLALAHRALFLTGTPMENKVEEFRTLIG